MKTDTVNNKLFFDNTAASVAGQGTTSAGGCKLQCETDRPCYVYIAPLQQDGKAYFQSGEVF